MMENNPLNLKNIIEIKEEKTDTVTEDGKISETDEVSILALSYGEVFIVENNQGGSLMWWISCNVCQVRFNSCENFLEHAINMHLNKKTKEYLKTENENVCDEDPQNICVESKNIIETIIDNEKSYKVEVLDGENSNNEQTDSEAKKKIGIEIELENIPTQSINRLKTNVKVSHQSSKKNDDEKVEKHICPHCDKSYSTKSRLKDHIASHLGLNPCFKCEQCGACLKSKSTLKSHMRIHTGERPFKCNLCSKTFRARPGLINHMIVHTGKKNFPCSFCGKLFQTRDHKERHEIIHTGERPFQCEECGDRFQTSSSLTEHNKRHRNFRPFVCEICEKSFFNNQQLMLHKVVHSNEKNFVCKICGTSFGRKKNLRTHERIHSESKDYKCKICDESFQTYAAINYHIKKKHEFAPLSYNYTPIGPRGRTVRMENNPLNIKNIIEIKEEKTDNVTEDGKISETDEVSILALSYGEVFIVENNQGGSLIWWISCNACQVRFNSCENFLDHAINMHLNKKTKEYLKTENENVCDEDPQNISAESKNINIEETIIDSEKSYKVEILDDENSNNGLTDSEAKNKIGMPLQIEVENIPTQSINRLKTKVKVSHQKSKRNDDKKVKKHLCPHCNKSYSTKSILKDHIASHLGLNPSFKCEQCGACLKSKSTLKSHMRIHTGERPFKCNLCSKTFRARPGLIGHMIVHTGKKNFPCSFCGKLFQTRDNKDRHEIIHTGERPFQCETCGDQFQTSSTLAEHNKRHRNFRPFVCEICEKSFYNNQQLMLHKVVHSNEKNFVCKICDARFGRKKNLRTHERIHSESKDYNCKICDESFQTYAAINYHIKKKHEFAPLSYNYTPKGPRGRK
ncbi:zinc finger protein 271-like [Condylostylus longicornis]|uniref:zinc finger protein 271-like n=1 Tax=Condylostylus longicornis TaxID=2530218 RepID=UPI00244E4F2B|nr:zinc finger protein 271-like [Condylostylus longicornis]